MIATLALVCGVMAGCQRDRQENRYRPGGAFYDLLDASGDRVLLVDENGRPKLKLRKRLTGYKVYDAELSPVGEVEWKVPTNGEKRPDLETLTVDALGDEQPRRLQRPQENVYELDGAFRIERTDPGWAVFDPQGGLLGSFEKIDASWVLKPNYGGSQAIRVDRSGRRVVVRDSEPILEMQAPSESLSDAELLAQSFETLDPLERTLLGVWLRFQDESGDS